MKKVKKIIGLLMIIAVFASIFVLIALEKGLLVTSFVYVMAIAIAAILKIGVDFMMS